MDLDDLKNQLKQLGAPEGDLDKIVNDIGIVVFNKILSAVLLKLSDDRRRELEGMSPDQITSHPNTIKDQITFPSRTELDGIYREVLESYFTSNVK